MFAGTRLGIVLPLLVVIAAGCWLVLSFPYIRFGQPEGNRLDRALDVFAYNESKHFTDPVDGCWYDSGDYIVFTQRNARSLFYLSLAWKEAKTDAARNSLRKVIDRQLNCFDNLLERGIKQIRDQDSHIAIVPPLLNQVMTPQTVYSFAEGEGRDVYAIRSLIAANLLDAEGERYWRDRAEAASGATFSSNCCEEGPIHFSDKELSAIEFLAGIAEREDQPGGWGINFSNLALVRVKDSLKIRAILKEVQQYWDGGVPKQFDYIGGNYDIAGTVALERYYARMTGDQSFKEFSDKLFSYLYGDNIYHTDFTRYPRPHHPCGEWWSHCPLLETLVNGIDESLEFDTSRHDIWRLTEIQLTGQAEYVLALVLYLDL